MNILTIYLNFTCYFLQIIFFCFQFDLIRSQDDMDKARALSFGINEGKDAVFVGNPNLRITSWLSMPMHGADFGWGKPVYFGLAGGTVQERALITHDPDGDGSVILFLHFQTDHIQLFKNYFYNDI